MSQITLNQEVSTQSTAVAEPESSVVVPQSGENIDASPQSFRPSEPGTFEYKPVPVYAPVATVIGLVSSAALMFEFFVLVAFFGVLFGGLATMRIRRSGGTLGGGLWANIGLLASVVFFFGGISAHVYAYVTEVPDGYQRVHFNREISKRQFAVVHGVRELHPEVAPLKDRKIFIKGFMYNTQKQTGLSDFVLLKDNGECCFGGSPQLYDMMIVKMPPDRTVDKIEGLVSVAGTLRCTPHSANVVYTVEADYVARARTSH